MPVRFVEDTHQYFDENGKELISVTTLLRKHGLAPDYSGVREDVLKAKAERGSLVHKEIETWIKTGEVGFTKELESFIKYVKDNDLYDIHSEVIVHNDIIAGTYDLMFMRNGICVRADFKTTANINKDLVAWQLSMYDYLDTRPCNELEIFHFEDDGSLKVVPVERIPHEMLVGLIVAEREGYKYELPTIALPPETIKEIREAQFQYAFAEEIKKKAEEVLAKFKDMLIEEMEKNHVKSFENEMIKVTYVAPYTKETLDTTRLKKEHPELAREYTKVSTTKGQVKITLKGDDTNDSEGNKKD